MFGIRLVNGINNSFQYYMYMPLYQVEAIDIDVTEFDAFAFQPFLFWNR